MKRLMLTGVAVCLIAAVVLIAGCTTTTTNNTATTTAGAANVSQYLTTTMQDRGFTIVTPFSRQATMQNGAVPYTGIVSDANGTYNVTYEVFNATQDAQARYQEVVNGYMNQGYTMMQQNSTAWSGFNPASSMGAGVSYGTSPLMPYYVLTMTGHSRSLQVPLQPGMWAHMWGEMYEHMSPYLGQNLTHAMWQHMREEMYEHMGGTPYGMPYGGGPMMGGRT